MQFLKGYEGKKIKVQVNGHSIDAVVSIRWDYEPSYPVLGYDFDFNDAEANKEHVRRFEAGELANVYVQVSVAAEGLEGMDCLGMCCVKTNEFVSDVREIVKDNGMIANARTDLAKQILNAANRFPKYLTKAG